MDIIKNKWIKVVFAFLIIGSFISCEDEADNYQENPYTLNSDIGLQYQNLSSYSYKEVIKSAQPDFKIANSVYSFSILTIKKGGVILTSGKDIFTIDPKTGVISINNANASLVPGETYTFDVGLGNINGIIKNENVFTLEVFDTPLSYSISNTTYDAKFLEVADIATVTYEDTSAEGDVLSDIVYSLSNPPAGFSINASTGVISKNTDATSGVHKISVIINSNLGPKTFTDVLEVTVGEAPTLTYVQANGTTPLSNVILSPSTAYTTVPPMMDGMNAVSYEIILPETLTAGSVIANNDGRIAVLADQNLAVGVHSLGVIAKNAAGITATFENQFTITVIEQPGSWSQVFFNDFESVTVNATPVEDIDPNLKAYSLNENISVCNVFMRTNSGSEINGVRFSAAKLAAIDMSLTLKLAQLPSWEKLRVSFVHNFGNNTKVFPTRTVAIGNSVSDLEAGTYNDANWKIIIASNDSQWGSSTWTPTIMTSEVALDSQNADMYLNWRVKKTTTEEGLAEALQDYYDDIKVEVFEKAPPSAPIEE